MIMGNKQEKLFQAFYGEDIDEVFALLKVIENHAEIRDDDNNWTLLHYAAGYAWTNVCQQLVELYHVDPHARDSCGKTALHVACLRHDGIDTVKYLVKHAGCDPLIEDDDGYTPFDLSEGIGETRDFLQSIIDDKAKKEAGPEVTYSKCSLLDHSDQLTTSNMFNLLQDKSSQWDSIGRAFGASVNDRDNLQQNPAYNNDRRLEVILEKWLESTSNPTWAKFCSILTDSLKFNDVAKQAFHGHQK